MIWSLARRNTDSDARNPYASPLDGDLHDLPPSLLQVGSDEIPRDGAVAIVRL
jgi:acetyl esterase/lipase